LSSLYEKRVQNVRDSLAQNGSVSQLITVLQSIDMYSYAKEQEFCTKD